MRMTIAPMKSESELRVSEKMVRLSEIPLALALRISSSRLANRPTAIPYLAEVTLKGRVPEKRPGWTW